MSTCGKGSAAPGRSSSCAPRASRTSTGSVVGGRGGGGGGSVSVTTNRNANPAGDEPTAEEQVLPSVLPLYTEKKNVCG